ncbi:MAG: ATP-binding cassette domain-containing protein, partial [Dehalococcoidia bacterium]|nr:ATP-binding cassette domain-containing protein [Dehalococcoidia bacterium]
IARARGASPSRVEQMLEVVGLVEHARKRPAQLSGGLRQRLGLALALIGEPRVLLLDEPTANLDVESRHVVFEVLRRERERGVAILFTTHRVDEVVELASRVVTLDGGRVSSEEDRSTFVHRFQGRQGALLHVEAGTADAVARVLTGAGMTVESHADAWITVHGVPLHELVRVLARAEVDALELIPRGEF